jgi:Uma2 family endonuclease
VTSAQDWDHMPTDGWTTDDLDELPEDGIRRELIDGVLHVSPSPTHFHQSIAGRLMVALGRRCPPEYEVAQGVEVRINRRRSLIPDVLAVAAEAAARNPAKFAPHEVALALEIVSPTSETTDRFTKPALYASAEIPFYWVIDVLPRQVNVVTHRLDPVECRYVPTGQFTERISVREPWEIDIPIEDILPPSLRTR